MSDHVGEGSATPMLIVIAGPIAAGKSTVGRALTGRLRDLGEKVALVESDVIAEMALPTLPDWGDAHAIFNSVVAQWLTTPLTVVVAEGPGSRSEIGALVDAVAASVPRMLVVLTSPFDVAFARASADPLRGISRDRDFLSTVFDEWVEEMPLIHSDVLIDTGVSSLDESVTLLVEELQRRRTERRSDG